MAVFGKGGIMKKYIDQLLPDKKGLGREKRAEIKADVHAVTGEENDYAFYWPEGVVNENVRVGCESFNTDEGLRMNKCQFPS